MLIGVLGVVVAIVILVVVLVQRSRARTAAAYAAARLMVVDPDPALRDLILSLWTQRPPSPDVKLELLSLHRSEETSDEVYSVLVRTRERHPFVRQGRITVREGRGTFMRSPRLRGPALELIRKTLGGGGRRGRRGEARRRRRAAWATLRWSRSCRSSGRPSHSPTMPSSARATSSWLPTWKPPVPTSRPSDGGCSSTLEGAQLSSRPGFALVQRPGGEILQRGEPLEVRLRTDLDAARRVLTALSS